MPTPYKGKLRISCKREVCYGDPVRADVKADCFGCADAAVEILDLDDRVILSLGEFHIAFLSKPAPSEAAPEGVAKKVKKKGVKF